MMNITYGNAVAYMIVPHGKHPPFDIGVTFLKTLTTHVGRCPVFIKRFNIEIIIIISGNGHYVNITVGNADNVVSLLNHFLGLRIAIVPAIHQDVLALDGSCSVGMGEGSPNTGLLAVLLDQTDTMVGKIAELFHDLLVGIGILVGTDMHAFAHEHGIIALEIFAEKRIDKGIGFGVKKIKMVHAILLAADRRLVLRKGQRMRRHVDFGNNFYPQTVGKSWKARNSSLV